MQRVPVGFPSETLKRLINNELLRLRVAWTIIPVHAPLVVPRHVRKSTSAARRMTCLLSRPHDRPTFDAAAEAAVLKADTRARRRRPRASSRLDRHTHELLALYDAGATIAELQRWLEARRVRVHQTTVGRWLRRRG